MAETVNLDVTTLEESVSVTTTDGGTVEVAVQAQRGETGATGATGAAGPNSVTSATTTNFTTGQVLYANGSNVGSLSRSGIDTRTSFPNDDVTAATASPDPDTIVKRNGTGDIVAASSFLTNEGGGFSAGGITGFTNHQVTLNYPATTASRAWTFQDADGTVAHLSDIPAALTYGTGVTTALAVNIGSAGAFVVNGGALGTPSSGTLTSCTDLPISTGVSGLGANVATFLATPSSANLAAAVTDETGTGSLVFATSPTITTPTIARSGNGTVTTFQDGSGKTVTVETASFGTQVILNGTGGTLGAYLTLNGQNESWVNVIAASNTTDLRWMRFGNGSNAQRDRFSIQRLNDTATIIRATPFSLANNAPTNSFYMHASGGVSYGNTTDPGAGNIILNGNQIIIGTAQTPASATAAGTAGTICWDANYVYICINTNTWRRIAHATW